MRHARFLEVGHGIIEVVAQFPNEAPTLEPPELE